MRFINIIIILFSAKLLSAQSFDGSFKNQLYAITALDAGSSALSSRFISLYINGGYISNSVKDVFFNKLSNSNRVGLISDTEIGFKKFSRRSNDIFPSFQSFSLENFNQYEADFSKDLFGLYYYGNKLFEGKTISLSNLKYTQEKYQILKFGIYQRFGMLGFGCNVGLVMGQNFLEISTGSSNLFTAPFGEYIDFNLKLKSTSSDLTNDRFFSLEGTGVSFDLKFDVISKKNINFGIGTDRLGFVKYTNKNYLHTVDSSFRFEGVRIESILDSFVINIKRPEEYKDELLKEQITGAIRKSLVSKYYLYCSYRFPQSNLWIVSKLSFMPKSLYRPSWQSECNFNITRKLLIGVDAGIGGYSKWNIGANFGIQLGKILEIKLSANSLFNLINVNKPLSAIAGANFKLNF